jgi:hypothetical protein
VKANALLQAAQSIMTKMDTNSLFQKLWAQVVCIHFRLIEFIEYQSCNALHIIWCYYFYIHLTS